jgi:hypothetical protein
MQTDSKLPGAPPGSAPLGGSAVAQHCAACKHFSVRPEITGYTMGFCDEFLRAVAAADGTYCTLYTLRANPPNDQAERPGADSH